MTQALNLALFANKLNTSGATDNTGLQNSAVTVTAGTGMSGGGSVALGSSVTLNNAGVTSVSAGTGISVSASTGGVTISASGGGVTSLNGQTGAVVTTNIDAIGSVIWAANCTTSTIAGGATTAGSNLRYPSTVSSSQSVTVGQNYYSENPSVPYSITFTIWNSICCIRQTEGNSGYQLPIGTTTLSGTWRAMGGTGSRSSNYNGDGNVTQSQNYVGLFVRVS
jgi:hypothetical protein